VVEASYNPSTQEAEAEDCEFKISLGYMVRPCLKKQKNKANKKKRTN
jgi:hypothetical protein